MHGRDGESRIDGFIIENWMTDLWKHTATLVDGKRRSSGRYIKVTLIRRTHRSCDEKKKEGEHGEHGEKGEIWRKGMEKGRKGERGQKGREDGKKKRNYPNVQASKHPNILKTVDP